MLELENVLLAPCNIFHKVIFYISGYCSYAIFCGPCQSWLSKVSKNAFYIPPLHIQKCLELNLLLIIFSLFYYRIDCNAERCGICEEAFTAGEEDIASVRCSDSCEACAGGDGGEETVRRKKRVSAVKLNINEVII